MRRSKNNQHMFWTEYLDNNYVRSKRKIAIIPNTSNYENSVIRAIRNLTFYGLLRETTGNGKYIRAASKI